MNIYVANIPWKATEDQLKQHFAAFGEVTSAKIIMVRQAIPGKIEARIFTRLNKSHLCTALHRATIKALLKAHLRLPAPQVAGRGERRDADVGE